MKNKILIAAICISVIAGLVFIGISADKIFKTNGTFILTGIGIGLLIVARYLELKRNDD